MDYHDHATFSEKVRGAFEDLDVSRQRNITMDAWLSGMKRLRLDLSLTTVSVADLFIKADLNGDNCISFSEFQRFAEFHPTLLDSVYYRSKDYWTDAKEKDAIEEAKAVMQELREREDQVAQANRESQHLREQHEVKVQNTEALILECKRHEEDLKENLRQAKQTTLQGRNIVADKQQEVAMMRDREGQIQQCIRETGAKTEQLIETLRYHDAEVAATEERLRQIERMLLDLRGELDQKIGQREAVHQEVSTSSSREEAAAADLRDTQMMIQSMLEAARVAEENVIAFERAEREAQGLLQNASTDCMKSVGNRDAALRELQVVAEREQQSHAVLQNSHSATEAQALAIHESEQRNADFNQHRRLVEEEEAPLIDQEALLKEQRDHLDEREARLRSDVHVFTSNNGRSPATSPRAQSVLQGPAAAMSPPGVDVRSVEALRSRVLQPGAGVPGAMAPPSSGRPRAEPYQLPPQGISAMHINLGGGTRLRY